LSVTQMKIMTKVLLGPRHRLNNISELKNDYLA